MPQLLYNLALFFVTYALVQLTCDIWIRWAISEKKCLRGATVVKHMRSQWLHCMS